MLILLTLLISESSHLGRPWPRQLIAGMGGKVLRLTRGISGAHCVRLGYAKFSPSLRYGENFLCPGNVICNKPARFRLK